MGRAKRKHRPPTAPATRVEREPPLDGRAVEAILAVYGDGNGDGNLTIGLRYAVVAGTAVWAVIGLIVLLV